MQVAEFHLSPENSPRLGASAWKKEANQASEAEQVYLEPTQKPQMPGIPAEFNANIIARDGRSKMVSGSSISSLSSREEGSQEPNWHRYLVDDEDGKEARQSAQNTSVQGMVRQWEGTERAQIAKHAVYGVHSGGIEETREKIGDPLQTAKEKAQEWATVGQAVIKAKQELLEGPTGYPAAYGQQRELVLMGDLNASDALLRAKERAQSWAFQTSMVEKNPQGMPQSVEDDWSLIRNRTSLNQKSSSEILTPLAQQPSLAAFARDQAYHTSLDRQHSERQRSISPPGGRQNLHRNPSVGGALSQSSVASSWHHVQSGTTAAPQMVYGQQQGQEQVMSGRVGAVTKESSHSHTQGWNYKLPMPPLQVVTRAQSTSVAPKSPVPSLNLQQVLQHHHNDYSHPASARSMRSTGSTQATPRSLSELLGGEVPQEEASALEAHKNVEDRLAKCNNMLGDLLNRNRTPR